MPITAQEFKEAKRFLNVSYEKLAFKMEVHPRTIMRWASEGVGGAPAVLIKLLIEQKVAKLKEDAK